MHGTVKDYYGILGLDPHADEQDIKAAFRRMARRYHPDINPDEARTEQRFKDIDEAYRVLSSPVSRRAYDDAHAGGLGRPRHATASGVTYARADAYSAPHAPHAPRHTVIRFLRDERDFLVYICRRVGAAGACGARIGRGRRAAVIVGVLLLCLLAQQRFALLPRWGADVGPAQTRPLVVHVHARIRHRGPAYLFGTCIRGCAPHTQVSETRITKNGR